MNRNFPVLRFFFSFSSVPFLMSAAICIVLFFSLSSCDTGSKGRYKFQAKSMHWLQYRGPNASGIASEDANPPVHFTADTNLLWKTEVLPGWSSPCIVNERIFLTGYKETDSTLYTIAINRKNGQIDWRDSIQFDAVYFNHPLNTYANPTIASDGKKIFAHFPGYGMIAYKLDGHKVWEYQHDLIAHMMSGGSSPIVHEGSVIFNMSSSTSPGILALDCETGDVVQNISNTEHLHSLANTNSTPAMLGNLIIMHQEVEIVAYNIKTGQEEWWWPTSTTAIATPVFRDSIMYLNTWSNFGEDKLKGLNFTYEELLTDYDFDNNRILDQNEMPATLMVYQRPESEVSFTSSMSLKDDAFFLFFDGNVDGAIDASEWEGMLAFCEPFLNSHGMMAFNTKGTGKMPDTNVIWKVTEDTPEIPSPLLLENHLFFIKNGGIMTVIDRRSGEVVKKERIGAPGTYIASPLLAGNRIYVCAHNGKISVLSADDYTVLSQNKLNEKIGSSPVAVDDVLYVRTDKHLYAFRDQ
jgi:outer membrane protein assembly factor BamB